jgi:SAM-dependent methyltransferase
VVPGTTAGLGRTWEDHSGENSDQEAAVAEVDYDHARHVHTHTVVGAQAALRLLYATRLPKSILDVGCGRGTWLRAALDLGVPDVFGIDGAAISESDFLCPHQLFRRQDLSERWDLGRRFDVALCLEVAEHLPADAASTLIASLVEHADVILFSAAVPGQPGQHHVNCQWPEYWQEMFNARGYTCNDIVRWRIWDDADIEPWYRQNMFMATRAPDAAAREDRIRPVVHPALFDAVLAYHRRQYEQYASEINSGVWPVSWYVSLLHRAAIGKLKRKFARFSRAV